MASMSTSTPQTTQSQLHPHASTPLRQLPTKTGRPPSASPRTLDTNRRRLGDLLSSFAALALGRSATTEEGLEGESDDVSTVDGLPSLHGLKSIRVDADLDQDEGCFVDPESACVPGSPFLSLPDELVLHVFTFLPTTAAQLLTLTLVSQRIHDLAFSPILWARAFDAQPGFRLRPEARDLIVATNIPPKDPSAAPKPTGWFGRRPRAPPSNPDLSRESNSTSIPVHFPTLFRSRAALSRCMRRPGLMDAPQTTTVSAHQDSVYCVDIQDQWVVTGSRDRSIRLWKLPGLLTTATSDTSDEEDDGDGKGREQGARSAREVAKVSKAHTGSVLSVCFELKRNEKDQLVGEIVTGSSDKTAAVWLVHWEGDEVTMEKEVSLTGHTEAVLDVAFNEDRIVSCSKDFSVRVYDRTTHENLHVLNHHTGPVNALALHPTWRGHAVSASGDGSWVVFDIYSGEVLLRGENNPGLACVAWEMDAILAGCNHRSIKMFSSTSGELIREFIGHTDLVRALAVDLESGLVVSGSYDRSIRIWDTRTGECLRRLPGHSSLVFDLALQGPRLISASHDTSFQVTTFGLGLPYIDLFA